MCEFRSHKQQKTTEKEGVPEGMCVLHNACRTTRWVPACKLGTQLGSIDSKSATGKGP